MKKPLRKILVILLVLVVIGSAGYYFFSSYFTNRVLDEPAAAEALKLIDPAITTEKVEEIKESLSATDKMYLTSSIIGKLDKDMISSVTEMSADGFSQEELSEVKQILSQKFSEEDINKLKDLYSKYANKS